MHKEEIYYWHNGQRVSQTTFASYLSPNSTNLLEMVHHWQDGSGIYISFVGDRTHGVTLKIDPLRRISCTLWHKGQVLGELEQVLKERGRLWFIAEYGTSAEKMSEEGVTKLLKNF